MHISPLSLRAIAISAALVLSGAAYAQSRLSTVNMSCAQAQATVKSAGAVVLGTGGGSYDRFVASGGFCSFQEVAAPTWVPARDTAHCAIGFVCETVAGRDASPN